MPTRQSQVKGSNPSTRVIEQRGMQRDVSEFVSRNEWTQQDPSLESWLASMVVVVVVEDETQK